MSIFEDQIILIQVPKYFKQLSNIRSTTYISKKLVLFFKLKLNQILKTSKRLVKAQIFPEAHKLSATEVK